MELKDIQNKKEDLDIQDTLKKADSYFQHNHHAAALKLLDKILNQEPKNVEALIMKANVNEGLGRFHEAIEFYDQVLKIQPKDLDTIQKKIDSLIIIRNYEDAISTIDKALEINPTDESLLKLKANSLFKIAKYEDAISTIDKALEINPTYESLLKLKVNSLFKIAKYEDAISTIDKPLEINPTDESLLKLKDESLIELGKIEKALSIFDKILGSMPPDKKIHYKTLSYYNRQQFEKAIILYNKLLEKNPDDTNLLNGLTTAFVKQGGYEQALNFCKKTLKIDPNNKTAKDNKELILSKIEEGKIHESEEKRVSREVAVDIILVALIIIPVLIGAGFYFYSELAVYQFSDCSSIWENLNKAFSEELEEYCLSTHYFELAGGLLWLTGLVFLIMAKFRFNLSWSTIAPK